MFSNSFLGLDKKLTQKQSEKKALKKQKIATKRTMIELKKKAVEKTIEKPQEQITIIPTSETKVVETPITGYSTTTPLITGVSSSYVPTYAASNEVINPEIQQDIGVSTIEKIKSALPISPIWLLVGLAGIILLFGGKR